MAGKRLLDAAKLVNAARSIGKQHVVLRQEQWDVYSKTSSLGKAVKDQTDRVTVTASAAYELAKRLNETGPTWQQSQSSERPPEQSHDATSRPSAAKARSYDESKSQNSAASGTSQDVPLEFAARNNVPEERAYEDEKLSSFRERERQRATEEPSPIARADAQLSSEQRRNLDNFNDLTDSVPEEAEIARRSDPRGHNESVAQDDFRTADGRMQSSEEELPESVSIDGLFSSRRVSREVGKTGPNIQNPYGNRKKLPPKPLPEMVKAEEHRKMQEDAASVKSKAVNSESKDSAGMEGDVETQKLAESIAQESEVQFNTLQRYYVLI